MKSRIKKINLIIVMLICLLQKQAVAQYDTTEMKAIQYGNSLITNINSSREYISVLNELVSHTEYYKYRDYMDMLAWWYSYVGITKKAIEIEDNFFPKKRKQEFFIPGDYTIVDAVKTIIAKADGQQVIMINEEHRMPRHRVLTYQLLAPLYKKGYRYLAVETVSDDVTLSQAGVPVLKTGTYSKDPVFAGMLRTAVKLGFTIVPYDVGKFPDEYRKMNSIQRQMYREEMQAKNIINRILSKDAKAKIIVHGGRDHIAKIYEQQEIGADTMMVGTMAGAFRFFSGIDPFTIDQLKHAEHSDTLFESSVFKWARTQSSLGKLNVLVDKNTNDHFSVKGGPYNMSIIPSATQYLYGRPDWLIEMPGRNKKYIDVNSFQPARDEYFMVQAFYADYKREDAVPADQYAYQKGNGKILLLLEKGNFLFRILNDKAEIIKQWQEKIK